VKSAYTIGIIYIMFILFSNINITKLIIFKLITKNKRPDISNKTLNQGDKKIIIKTLMNVCCNNCEKKY